MPLFDEQVSRKPNQYPWAQDVIDAVWHSFWTPNEFSFRSDYSQFHGELTDQERGVIVRTLSAIGQVEIAVKRYWADIGKIFPHPYISDMGLAIGNQEVIHNQAYEKLLDVLGLQSAFDEALQTPQLLGRIEYLRKYLDNPYKDHKQRAVYSLVLFTLFVENCSLFSQFYIIMHFNRFKAVLKDTAQQVQYTRNEELLHAKAGTMIINTLRQEYPDLFDDDLNHRINEECANALRYEGAIIDWILQGYEQPALNADVVKAFLQDRMVQSMKDAGFDVELPDADPVLLEQSEWMNEEVYGGTMTDFFNKRPVEYAKNNRNFDSEDLF